MRRMYSQSQLETIISNKIDDKVKLYEHIIQIEGANQSVSGTVCSGMIRWIDNVSTVTYTFAQLAQRLYALGYNGSKQWLPSSMMYNNGTVSVPVVGIYADNSSNLYCAMQVDAGEIFQLATTSIIQCSVRTIL